MREHNTQLAVELQLGKGYLPNVHGMIIQDNLYTWSSTFDLYKL
jgi:hypothetical protein